MLQTGDQAPQFFLEQLNRQSLSFDSEVGPTLLVFFETDCPTCRLTIPYLNKLAREVTNTQVLGISQDSEAATRELVEQLPIEFPVVLDRDLSVSRAYDPVAVPTLFLIGEGGTVVATEIGFNKASLNDMARIIAEAAGLEPQTIAPDFDGAPHSKPGCTSRHLEPATEGDLAPVASSYAIRGSRASRVRRAWRFWATG